MADEFETLLDENLDDLRTLAESDLPLAPAAAALVSYAESDSRSRSSANSDREASGASSSA